MNLEIPSEALSVNQGRNDEQIEETSFLYAREHKLPVFTRYREGTWREEFYFIQITDLKIGETSMPEEKWQDELELLKRALESISQMKPKPRFVVFTGNFTSQSPGGNLHEAQVRDFKSTVSTGLDNSVPVVCISGQCDTGNPQTKTNIEKYRDNFGEDWFVFWVEGVQFIAINSSYYKENEGVSEWKNEQDEWLESQLFEAQFSVPKHVIMLQSVPWFHSNVEENNDCMNISIDTRTGVMQKLKDACVSTVITGSMTRNNTACLGNLQIITTNPLSSAGEEPPGIRVIKVLENRIEHEYFELTNIPAEIVLGS